MNPVPTRAFAYCKLLYLILSLAQIPDGLMDCVLGGDNCPFEDFDDFAEWFETTTGISVGRQN